MRAIIQRVKKASVMVDQKICATIDTGILVLLGISDKDTLEDILWISKKIVNLRIFNDAQGVMNRSVKEIDGQIIVVSQFTLLASTKKGNRPSYIKAAKPDLAMPIYEQFILKIEAELGKQVDQGVFGADMQVSLINDGPVTISLDSNLKE